MSQTFPIPVESTVATNLQQYDLSVIASNLHQYDLSVLEGNIPIPTVANDMQRYDLSVLEDNVPVSLKVSTKIVSGDIDDYDGPYIIIPSLNEQVLQTKNHRMDDDVTVREIPYYETSNPKGITVYIAESIND